MVLVSPAVPLGLNSGRSPVFLLVMLLATTLAVAQPAPTVRGAAGQVAVIDPAGATAEGVCCGLSARKAAFGVWYQIFSLAALEGTKPVNDAGELVPSARQ